MYKTSEFNIGMMGFFDSRTKFSHKETDHITKDRPVFEYEIEFFIENTGTAFINGTSYDIKKNHILIAKPGQIRHSRLHFRAYYIHLGGCSHSIKKALDSLPDYFEVTKFHEYLQIFNKIFDTIQKNSCEQELFVISKIYELLYMFSDDLKKQQIKIGKNSLELVSYAKSFMEKNYTMPLSLSETASAINLHPVYFHKLFKTIEGKTPHEYLLEIRIGIAKKMLSETKASVSEVAANCGFSSQSYFNSVFKNKTGFTPTSYRNSELQKYHI